jgi:hypothetical protein
MHDGVVEEVDLIKAYFVIDLVMALTTVPSIDNRP